MSAVQGPTLKTVVRFVSVESNPAKLACICDVIGQHFSNRQRILVLAPSPEAARYIDNLLWSFSEESFLPHTVADHNSKEAIVVTTLVRNLNRAQVLVNLCPQACPIAEQFEIVCELLDKTHPDKESLSRQRMAAYLVSGLQVAME